MRALGRRALSAPGGWPVHLALCVLLLPRAVLLGEALFERDLHIDFRGVAVPAGRHVIEMRYRPWPVMAGISLFASGLVTLVTRFGLLVRRRLTPASSTSSAGSPRAFAS